MFIFFQSKQNSGNRISWNYPFLIFCFVIGILSSCKKPEVKIPTDIIQKDSMVQVIVDIQIAEAAITQKNVIHQYGLEFTAPFYKYVFDKHHINAQLYGKSIKFYSSHPEIYKEMYEQVITELSKRQAAVNH